VRFELDEDQRDFASALESLLAGAGTVAAARAWADGDHAPGLGLWKRLADLGVTSLATDASPVEVAIAFEAIGRHVVPGPWIESAAFLPVLLGREVEGVATAVVPPHVPLALDADVADQVYVGATPTTQVGALRGSVDRTRRLFEVDGADLNQGTPRLREAIDLAVLACSAELLGAGERVLTDSVTYVKQRTQFGRPIGSYQAIKHALADVRIALDFARPLVLGAALGDVPVSAAKVAAGDAAYLASRTGLQVHGAIGYTQEFDLSLWLGRIRALVGAWGTASFHRERLLQQLTETGAEVR
jgi:alkylation response protein AidB-like acyl-CoA dehydrogenase